MPFFRDFEVKMNMLVDGKELKEYPDRFFEVQNPYPEYKRKGPWEWRYRTDDLTLFEYPEGQEERERWPRRVNTSRYVEGRPGQRYTFRFHFGANFVFKDTDVYVRIYADDQFTDGMHVKKAGFLIPRGHTFSKDTACYRERGMSVKPNYHFVDIEMTDDGDEEDEERRVRSGVGSVRILMWRINLLEGRKKFLKDGGQDRPVDATHRSHHIREQKKNGIPDLGTNFVGNGKKGNPPLIPKKYLDGAPKRKPKGHKGEHPEYCLRHPFLEVRLKYRSRSYPPLDRQGQLRGRWGGKNAARAATVRRQQQRPRRGALASRNDTRSSTTAQQTPRPGSPEDPIELDDRLEPGDDPEVAIIIHDDVTEEIAVTIEPDDAPLGREYFMWHG